MTEYKMVEVSSYVKEGIANGSMIPFQAEKIARVIAKRGVVGEKVVSWSVDQNGDAIQEKVAEVMLDKNTKQPGWIATKADENGNIIIDENGHFNQWIIDDTTFNKKYEIDVEGVQLYRPRGSLQMFVRVYENIILSQWGNDMKIASGGYINITDEKDMYGISERDFNDTYRLVDISLGKVIKRY